jgi:hypothetical protein
MWMGGNVSLGYDVKDQRSRGVDCPAGSVALLQAELEKSGIVSKRRAGAGGALCGGKRFSRGALYLMPAEPALSRRGRA